MHSSTLNLCEKIKMTLYSHINPISHPMQIITRINKIRTFSEATKHQQYCDNQKIMNRHVLDVVEQAGAPAILEM